MSERDGIQTDEGGGGKNCEPQLHVGIPSLTVHPPEVFQCLSCSAPLIPSPTKKIWWPFGDPVEPLCLDCRLTLSEALHPPEVFPPLPSVSDLLHLDVLSTVEALRALPQSKVVLLRLEHP